MIGEPFPCDAESRSDDVVSNDTAAVAVVLRSANDITVTAHSAELGINNENVSTSSAPDEEKTKEETAPCGIEKLAGYAFAVMACAGFVPLKDARSIRASSRVINEALLTYFEENLWCRSVVSGTPFHTLMPRNIILVPEKTSDAVIRAAKAFLGSFDISRITCGARGDKKNDARNDTLGHCEACLPSDLPTLESPFEQYAVRSMRITVPILPIVPTTLTRLEIASCSFNSPLNNSLKYTAIQWLDLGDAFDQPIDGLLPPNLVHLRIGERFDHSVAHLPASLTSLHLGLLFNRSIDMLPDNIKDLCIGDSFSQQARKLPLCLEKLAIGAAFNPDGRWGPLPMGLTSLKLGTRFAAPLESFPRVLTTLSFGCAFNIPIKRGTLPSTLERVMFGCRYSQPLGAHNLPKSLWCMMIHEKAVPCLRMPMPSSLTWLGIAGRPSDDTKTPLPEMPAEVKIVEYTAYGCQGGYFKMNFGQYGDIDFQCHVPTVNYRGRITALRPDSLHFGYNEYLAGYGQTLAESIRTLDACIRYYGGQGVCIVAAPENRVAYDNGYRCYFASHHFRNNIHKWHLSA